MKNILTISVVEFRREAPKLTISQIKTLLRGIYDHKRTMNPNQQDQICDLERKETILMIQLQTHRKYLTSKDNGDYNGWIKTLGKNDDTCDSIEYRQIRPC